MLLAGWQAGRQASKQAGGQAEWGRGGDEGRTGSYLAVRRALGRGGLSRCLALVLWFTANLEVTPVAGRED